MSDMRGPGLLDCFEVQVEWSCSTITEIRHDVGISAYMRIRVLSNTWNISAGRDWRV